MLKDFEFFDAMAKVGGSYIAEFFFCVQVTVSSYFPRVTSDSESGHSSSSSYLRSSLKDSFNTMFIYIVESTSCKIVVERRSVAGFRII